MNNKMGMDLGTVMIKRDAMQTQINALTAIAADLLTTHSAARNPESYGIDSGERTVAPWSIHNLSSARTSIVNAHSAANSLLVRLSSEAQSQKDASAANGWDVFAGGYGLLKDISWWRRWVSWPRTLLELPAAVQMLIMQGRPGLKFGFNVANWGLAGSGRGGAALRAFTMWHETPRWIRSLYIKGNNLKIQNVINPKYLGVVGQHARPPAWMNALKVKDAGLVSKIGTGITVAGKGFAILGAVGSAATLGSGIAGMMDGDVTSGDAWAVADGTIGLITSVGSLAPPPVGVAFAAVGLAYTAGRWLFGADENGKTGIDKIGDFANSTGKVVSDVAKNTGKFVGDVAKNVGDAVKDLWPW